MFQDEYEITYRMNGEAGITTCFTYRLHAIDATSTKQYRITVNNNGNITIVYPYSLILIIIKNLVKVVGLQHFPFV